LLIGYKDQVTSNWKNFLAPIGFDHSYWSFRTFRLECMGDATCLKIIHLANRIPNRIWSLDCSWSLEYTMELHIDILRGYHCGFSRSVLEDTKYWWNIFSDYYWRHNMDCRHSHWNKILFSFCTNHINSTLLAQDRYTWIVKSTQLVSPSNCDSDAFSILSTWSPFVMEATLRMQGCLPLSPIELWETKRLGFIWEWLWNFIDHPLSTVLAGKFGIKWCAVGSRGSYFPHCISSQPFFLPIVTTSVCRDEALCLWKCALCLARLHLGWLRRQQGVQYRQGNSCTKT
jgi:hypothetical protein